MVWTGNRVFRRAFICGVLGAVWGVGVQGADPANTSTEWRDDAANLAAVAKLNESYGRAPFSWEFEGVLDACPEQPGGQDLLIPYRPDDDWEMALLYAHIVPPLIQMVEPTPPEHGVIWVLREPDHELAAFVHVHDGPDAVWIHFFIHPNAQTEVINIVAAAVQVARPRADHPVYCCVRRYQSWLQTGLEQNGFQAYASQAVMVKHTVHPVRHKQPVQSTLVPAQGATTPPTPYMQLPERRMAPRITKRRIWNGNRARNGRSGDDG